MSDFNSSLPIRTENNGDVVVKVADATIPSQQMTVEADGSVNVNVVSGSITVSSEVEIKNDSGNPVPVSVASLPLPTGAATLAEQQTQSASLSSIDSKLTSPLTVQATNLDVRDLVFATDKVDVSGSSVSISGTPTVALDSASLTALESITVQNGSGASAVNIQDGGNSITVDGSISITEIGGIADYNTASNIAGGASNTHTYTATGNFRLTGVDATCSGRGKVEIKVNGTTKAVLFNTSSTPNMTIEFNKPILVTSGQTVTVIRTNRDNQPTDVYSTIKGYIA